VPTIARIGPYRFYFFADEGREPPHVHVQRERGKAKFWLEPVEFVRGKHLSPHELRIIEREVAQNRERFLEAWHAFFGR
jgi:hypothetical protein